jgi:nucleoside-diphosphate-sugar epimerase
VTSAIVSGASGFIGRYLAARLCGEGWTVREWRQDVREIGGCAEGAEVVFHLAAVTRHDGFSATVHEAYDVNVTGTQAVLSYCRRVGARCVLASTSAVYGPSDGPQPIGESAPVEPRSPYGISKWLAERACHRYASDDGVQATVLRFFNVYGAGQHPSFLVSYVVDSLTRGARVTLRMPRAVRDFLYVDDAVDALLAASRPRSELFRVFNVGSGQGVTVTDLVGAAENVFGRAAGIDTAEPHSGEAAAAVADVSLARQELGWTPGHDLEAGLAAMKTSIEAEPALSGPSGAAKRL